MKAPRITFYPREKEVPTSPIYVMVRLNGTRIRYSTGLLCNPKKFKSLDVPTAAILSGIESKLNNKILSYISEHDYKLPSRDLVIEWLDIMLRNREEEKVLSLLDAFEEWTGRAPTPSSVKSRKTTLLNLRAFYKMKGKIPKYEHFTQSFIHEFYIFLIDGRNERSTMVYITLLKGFLAYMLRNDAHTNDAYLRYKPKDFQEGEVKITEKRQAPVLSKEDFAKIQSLEFTDKKLEHARDLFMLMAFSAVRFIDVGKVIPENVIDGNIVFVPVKTRKKGRAVHIPLNSTIRRIWLKYNGEVKVPHYNTFRGYLKKIFDMCEDLSIPKDTITTHSARRSYITFLYNMGKYDSTSLCQISGHGTLEQLQNYVGKANTKDFASIEKDLDEFASPLKVVR